MLAVSPAGLLLLAANPGPHLDVTCNDLITAGLSADECAAYLLNKYVGAPAPLTLASTIQAPQGPLSIFRARYSDAFISGREDADYLLSHTGELRELAERDLITPLLACAIKALNL